ncbi:MAG: MlaE family ABC transporter permease [Fibrobacterota bacterium]
MVQILRKISRILLLDRIRTIVEWVGDLGRLIASTALRLPHLPGNLDITVYQMYSIGVQSIPLVLIVSLFTGAVACSQAAMQFQGIVPLTYLGTATAKVTFIELGPVITALVLSGRVGASIAAELGTMKTNEQIDAMECLSLEPLRYLVLPRIVAGTVMYVILTIIALFVALIGGWITAVAVVDITSHLYLSGLKFLFSIADVRLGLIKAGVFGFITTSVGCYFGINAEGGAEGVGKAAMGSVVATAVLVLILDFVIVALFLKV